MNHVCAVVLSFNRGKLLKKCIESVISQEKIRCDVLIIDNGDDEEVGRRYGNSAVEGVRYVRPEKNCGCAGGFNLGIRTAIQLGYKYIWTLDDDVIPYKNALSELIIVGEEVNGNWGILSSVAYWSDGSLCKANIQKKGLFTFLNKNDYGLNRIPVKMVSWASMLINSKAVYEVGLPISEYFIYSDDYEFSFRISSRFPVYVIPQSKVTHEMKSNKKANIVLSEGERLDRFNYLYRNDVHFYKRFGFKGIIYIFAKCMVTFVYIVLKEKKDKVGKIKILVGAAREGLTFDPKIEML